MKTRYFCNKGAEVMKFGTTKTHFCIGIAAAVLVMLLLTVGVFAAEEHGRVVESGKCGENLTWTLYYDGLLKISGTGKMDDYIPWVSGADSYAPWYNEREGIYSVDLDSGVTAIGNGAFYGCYNTTGSLTISNSVTSIGVNAFSRCQFTSLILEEGLAAIGDSWFEGMSAFTGTLTIPDSVESIGWSAFSGCSGFTGSLTIGNSVTSIENYAFKGCSGFTGSLTIGNSVTSIGKEAFNGCKGLKSVRIGESVSTLSKGIFYNCAGLETVTFDGNAPSVETNAFMGCPETLKFYCYKKYSASFTTYGGKWNGYPLIVLDDAEPTPEVGLCLTGAVLDVGSTIRFSASVPAGDTILWSSTDSNVASVENGTVTARSEGTTVIIAAAKNGRTSVSFDVTVNPAPEPAVKGDFDGDGHVTAKDRMILSRYLAGWPAYTIYFEQQ
ncbi:MAG: hypothetical protein E7576_10435 [Ruminococcaceae bacterium]|nr:hypothetical protein [Oscillospiraceae bacterium]